MQYFPLNDQQTINSDEYGTQMQSMFRNIAKQLQTMITNLTNIYRHHNVSWSINHEYCTFLRMTLPPQLTTYIYFSAEGEFREEALRVLQPYKYEGMRTTNFRSSPYEQRRNNGSYYQTKSETNNFPYSPRVSQISTSRNSSELPNDVLNRLCDWIDNQAKSGIQITKINIMKKAEQMAFQAKYPFRASRQWYKNFINSNIQVKQLIKASRSKIQQANGEANRTNNQQQNYKNRKNGGGEMQKIKQALNDAQNIDTQQVFLNEVVPQEKKVDIRQKYLADTFKCSRGDAQWRNGNENNHDDIIGYSQIIRKVRGQEGRK